MEHLGVFQAIIFIWACRMDQNSIFDGGDFWFTLLNWRYGPLKFSHMFVQGIHTCAFAMIYTSIETSPSVCIGKPYLLQLLCRKLLALGCKWLCYNFMGWFPDNFFFLLSVSAHLKKKIYSSLYYDLFFSHMNSRTIMATHNSSHYKKKKKLHTNNIYISRI